MLRAIATTLTGGAAFVYGLHEIAGAVAVLDQQALVIGMLAAFLGALVLAVEMTRW